MITSQTLIKLAHRLDNTDTAAFTKIAKIFGATPEFYNTGGSHRDFIDANKPVYDQYLKEKSKEKPTSKWTAGLVGGALGAIPGIAVDSQQGTRGLATGVLGGLGALVGLAVQYADERRIEEAKLILDSTDKSAKVKLALLKEISMRNDSDRYLQRRANEHIIAQTYK